MRSDLDEILARKRKDAPKAEVVKVWDRFYYVKKIQQEQFGVDSQEVRKYFDYEKVRDGILAVNQELFGVRFERVADAAVWHESVLAYNVFDGDRLVGRFNLDMHPREGKYGHAAMFNVVTGITDRQLPIASLVCNFPQPGAEGPALMEHGDVTTFFHEFGHLMHHLLGSGYRWANLSGISCEWDFVEAPSQILEEWAWNADVLARFARHHETGETIPADLVKKMREADEFGKGVHVMRQMSYAALSFNYHNADPAGIELLPRLKEILAKYSPYPYEEGTHEYANFGHLEGYSSMYYTYMWSLVIAKDLFTRFEKEGLMNPAVAADYRKFVVGAGGAVDASDMVEGFLGRPTSFDAFEAYLKK
jgi:thimet oligopeptidase